MHRFSQSGIQLLDSPAVGVMIQNSSESFLVVDVKSKPHLEPILIAFKDSVLGKSIESFSQGRNGVLIYQGRFCIPDMDDFRRKIF